MLLHVIFVLYYLLGLLSGPCTAFLEVGVSSYLGSSVHHFPEQREWTLVWPWNVNSGKGFFEATASGEKGFNESFVTPEPGIYFVALNLHIINTSDCCIKASLLINDEFEENNGIEGVCSNTTSRRTLSLSGLLRLYENDVLTLYLHGSKGTLLANSTFSVVLISPIGSVPGFHAVLSADLPIHMISRLKNFRTDGTKGLFVMHSGTSPSVGLFCSILEGIYFFSSNLNVKSENQLTGCHLAIVLNSNTTLVQRYSPGEVKYSISVSGIFYLNRGDCIELLLKPTVGGPLIVQLGSSFSGIFLGMKKDFSSQFSSSFSTGKQAGMTVGWNKVENWAISNLRRNFQSQYTVLEGNSSTFISETDGIFLVSTLVNINSSSNSMEKNLATLLVDVGDTSIGFTGYSSLSPWRTTSLCVSGVISLKKGDTLTVRINSDYHSWEITDGLLGVYLIPNNWPGVAATLTQTMPLDSHGWKKLTSWKTSNVTGLFSFDNSFFPNHGAYRTNVDGTYFLSCNVIFEGSPRGSLSLIIAIDDVIDTGNGLFSLNQNPKRYSTLNVVGSISLTKNQTISVYVAATEISYWNVSSKTGFSLVLVGANLPSTPGFFAVKEEEASPSSSCGEIDKWRTVPPTSDSFFKKGSQFNSTSGRFKAREDGFYLISANVLIYHSNLSQIRLNVLLDGQNDNTALSTFQPRHSSLPGSFFVSTLTLAGTIRLTSEQYISLSLDVQCLSGSSWKVLSNSSFSVVLVSLWDDDYAAGFLARTSLSSNGGSTYTKVYFWTAAFSKNLKVPFVESVYIEKSGLYFVQSVMILDDFNGNGVFHSGICASMNQILFNGFAASKVSEGLQGSFVISAFGVLFLQKGQKIDLCTRSEKESETYEHLKDSFFSMVRFLKPVQLPGLHETFQNVYNVSSPHERSFATSFSTAGNQLAYINNMFNPNPKSPRNKGDFTTTLNGTYFFSLSFTLTGNVSANITACVGPQKCAKCYIEVVGTLNYLTSTFGFVGLLDLEENELLSTCLYSQETSFSLVSATRSVQYLYELRSIEIVQLKHPSISFGLAGWHRLVGWRNSSGEAIQSIYVKYSGLYFLSLNLLLRVSSKGLVGVRLQAKEAVHQEILSIVSSAEADNSFSVNVAVLSRLNASQAMRISVYFDSNSLNIANNSTFSAALITNNNNHPCMSLKSKTSHYFADQWWQAIEPWEDVDAQCLFLSSEFSKGLFVTHVTGVYFVAAVVMIRASGTLNQTRMVQLLLSVNGETSNTNRLKATKAVTPGSTVALSLSATVHLEVLQTLYLMIRSTGDGTLEVLNGSTFSVALIEETKYYKSVARNISQFDNGPRIIRHPPPSVSLGEDLGQNVSWTCEAVAKGAVAYQWLRNDQTISSSNNLLLTNVQDSDSGRYVCVAEYDGVKVFSQAANLDVFDTSPQFENQVLTAPENSNVTIELNVSALNKRRRPADVFIKIVKGNTNGTFVLSETSKLNISLRNQLPFDYETTELYRLTLVATNQETNKTTSANVTIIITDINDNPPIFSSRDTVSVKENTPQDTVIFQVRATDADYGSNSFITYSLLSSEYAQEFSIDGLSGNITIIGNLDREKKSDITLLINATDGKFSVTSQLFVTITDVNDNKPRFTRGNNVSVEENTPLGKVIFQVSATDADYGNNSIITYSLVPSEYATKFSIDASSGNITVIGNLDRENTSEITLGINATDGTFTVTSELFVIITDVNDNKPIFISRNNISLEENIPSGTVIFQVRATDADCGNNSVISYTLLPTEYAAKFSIDPSSGNITVIGKLDRENTSEIILRINATDGTFPVTSELFVVITDVNDNEPIFTSRKNVSVEENTLPGTDIFQVRATDADYGNNSIITYSLLPSENAGKFSIDAASGNITVVGDLDRENTSVITLGINATDGTFTVTSELFVIITDVNDNKPTFISRNRVSVEENTPPGTVVFQVRATDADYGNNSIITYSLLPSEYAEKFSIGASSGNITVIGKLDRETTREIILRFNATDGTFIVTSELFVFITDVNDNKPIFTSRNNISVEENTPPGIVIFQVRATDADYGNNSIITYSLLPSEYVATFSIDPSSGNITVIGILDRENKSEVTLRINATDGTFSVTSELFVIITDVNDNGPIFTSGNDISVEENTSVGTVIFQVKATDADSGINAILNYTLLAGEYNEMFSIDSSSGNISITGDLDRERISNITLHVQVTDGKFNKSTDLFITVLDVNEFPPFFSAPNYEASIPENALVGDIVIVVSATDSDAVKNILIYSITSGNSNETFIINPENGSIFLHKPLDFERKKQYNLTVKVNDEGIPALESLTNVIVTVEDINDSPPVFTKCEAMVILQEPAPPQTQLFHVSTADADYGSNAIITYSIAKNEEGACNELYVDQDGNVYSNNSLPGKTICKVTIRASDGARTAECVVDLRVAEMTSGNTEGRTGFPTEAKYSLIAAFVFLLIVGAIVLIFRFFVNKRRLRSYKVKETRGDLSNLHLTSPIQPESEKEEKLGSKTRETEM